MKYTSLSIRSSFIVVVLMLFTISGCSFRNNAVSWGARPMLRGAMAALMSETDIELARSALESELKLLEGFIHIDPNDSELLLMAAEGFTGYAMMFLEDEDPNRARNIYNRAKRYGMSVLAQGNAQLVDSKLKFGDFQKLIEQVDKSDIDAAFWTSIAWSGEINLNRGSPKAIAEFPRAVLLMEKVLEFDEYYRHSGAHWFFGVYYSSIPPMLGGDAERARTHFDLALEKEERKYLLIQYLYAKHYCVQVQNRELFLELLNSVLDGPLDEPEDLRLLNRVIMEKSRGLIAQVDDLFY